MSIVPERMRRTRKHLITPVFSAADARTLELETAKQILTEVFHTKLCDVEDMIMKRLTEKCRPEEMGRIKENRGFGEWGTWPEMFQVEEEINI